MIKGSIFIGKVGFSDLMPLLRCHTTFSKSSLSVAVDKLQELYNWELQLQCMTWWPRLTTAMLATITVVRFCENILANDRIQQHRPRHIHQRWSYQWLNARVLETSVALVTFAWEQKQSYPSLNAFYETETTNFSLKKSDCVEGCRRTSNIFISP